MYKQIGIFLVSGLALLSLNAAHASSSIQLHPEILQAVLDDALATDNLTGITMAVWAPEQALWVGASGWSNVEARTAMQPNDQFRIASVTKTYISTTVLKLIEEGRLSLDDALADWLAESVTTNIPFAKRITVRQLLNHTSGIYDYLENDAFWDAVDANPSRVWQDKDVLQFLGGQSPYFEPGTAWQYSNTNYILLGLMIEAVTDSGLETQLRRIIFDPFQLNQTFLEVKEFIPGGMVQGYENDQRGDFDNVTKINTGNGLADGGIVSSAADVARFADALFRGPLLSEISQATMFTFVATDEPNDYYGLGISKTHTRFGNVLGHEGSILGYASVMWYLPDHDLIVVVLSNLDFADVVHVAKEALAELL